jgi:alpha-mannosidase
VIADPSDTWGHNAFRFNDVIGMFTATSVKLAEHGPAKSVIRVFSSYGTSRLIQDFTMYPDRDQIDVHVVVDWREQFKLLKLRFPVNVMFMRITREEAYGHIDTHANGDEMPMQRWVDVSGVARTRETPYGFSLLNDAKYSVDVNVRDIGLTVLRSPAYAHHIPAEVNPSELHPFIDQGIHQFSYSMLAHSGSWETAGTVRRAAELNQPPFVQFATFHPNGQLPQSDQFIDVQPEAVMVTVLKQAEDGDDLVVRAVETSGAAQHGTIRLPKWDRVIEADFAPGEIKTFRVPRMANQPVIETNLIEQNLV